jgi:hypothetical protein
MNINFRGACAGCRACCRPRRRANDGFRASLLDDAAPGSPVGVVAWPGSPVNLPASTSSTERAQMDSETDASEDQLNAALREELLFWTMLGLRTAAQDAFDEHAQSHFAERGHGRPIDARQYGYAELSGALATDLVVQEMLQTGRASADRQRYGDESAMPALGLADLKLSLEKSLIKFTDYCPTTMLSIRSRCRGGGFTTAASELADYKEAISNVGNAHFSLVGGGSGSFIFFSDDRRFLVKQIQATEFNTLITLLPSYHNYIKDNPETMLQHIYQISSCQMYRNRLYFMVVGNVHYTAAKSTPTHPNGHELHERYDLKGSWVNRNAAPTAFGASGAPFADFLALRARVPAESPRRRSALPAVRGHLRIRDQCLLLEAPVRLPAPAERDDEGHGPELPAADPAGQGCPTKEAVGS